MPAEKITQEEVRAKDRERYQRNREKVLARVRKYREANKAKIAARKRKYREENPERVRQPLRVQALPVSFGPAPFFNAFNLCRRPTSWGLRASIARSGI